MELPVADGFLIDPFNSQCSDSELNGTHGQARDVAGTINHAPVGVVSMSEYTTVTSESLLVRMQENIPQAWEEFLGAYERLMSRWLITKGAAQQDINDVLQDIFAFVYQEMPKFVHNGRTGAFRCWLRQVTLNRLREHWRKEKRRGSLVDWGELLEQIEADDSEISELWKQEHQQFVVNHLMSLIEHRFSEKSVHVFREVVLNQRSASDVAKEYGMTTNSVRVAQHRVMSALRQVGATWNE